MSTEVVVILMVISFVLGMGCIFHYLYADVVDLISSSRELRKRYEAIEKTNDKIIANHEELAKLNNRQIVMRDELIAIQDAHIKKLERKLINGAKIRGSPH